MANAQLSVTGNGTIKRNHPLIIRLIAQILSYLFHPLFIPIYVTVFVMYWHPFLFTGFSPGDKVRMLGTVFINLTLLPAFTVFLLWRLKFIKSLLLKTQKERIIPYAAAMIFYFWCWYVFRNFSEIPDFFRQFLLGSFVTVIIGWICNIYFKISMHALAVGGMALFVLFVVFNSSGSSGQYIAAAILMTGSVCTARMIVSDHEPFEIYSGLILGIFGQLVAIWV